MIGDPDYKLGPKGGTRDIEEQDQPVDGLNPNFFRLYELDCDFPVNYLLKISIKQKGTLWDKEIGQLIVDLEDRWYGDLKMK